MSRSQRSVPPRFATRLRWLVACVLGGAGVAVIGHAWSGQQAWYLALPAAIALGWLFFGTPHECATPGATPGARPGAGRGEPGAPREEP